MIKTHDILNEDLTQWHKYLGFFAYKIKEDHLRVVGPTYGLRGNQL